MKKVFIVRDEQDEFQVAFSTYDKAKEFLNLQKPLTPLGLSEVFVDAPFTESMSTCFVFDSDNNLINRYTKISKIEKEEIFFLPVVNRWLVRLPGYVDHDEAYKRCTNVIARYKKL